jgi:hypothetical protein
MRHYQLSIGNKQQATTCSTTHVDVDAAPELCGCVYAVCCVCTEPAARKGRVHVVFGGALRCLANGKTPSSTKKKAKQKQKQKAPAGAQNQEAEARGCVASKPN